MSVLLLTQRRPGLTEQGGLQSYSSKMMKSIWGDYNRYSVHNFKSSQSAGSAAGGGQSAGPAPRAQSGGLFH